jgi:hypothetical protein
MLQRNQSFINTPYKESTMHIRLILIATTLIFSSTLALAADDPITTQENKLKQVYGKQLMTEEERSEQRAKMRAATTTEEKEQIRKENQQRMKQRAKEQGVTLIDKRQNKQKGNTNSFDPRQTLPLNQAQQAHVLSEMRSLLAGTQAIVTALATDDMETVAKQARLLGMGMKKKPENKLHGILPKAFMMQGKAVHTAFDRIADDAESIKDPKHTLMQLGKALSICQGCHEMYRIEANNTNVGMGKHKMQLHQNNNSAGMKHKGNNK